VVPALEDLTDQVDPILTAASIELTGDDIDEIEARTR
jgi:hypothetical protein